MVVKYARNGNPWGSGVQKDMEKRCGREEVLALQNHYDGKSEGKRRKQVAKDNLKMLFYRNETTFSFEKYITKLKQKFNVL